MTIFSSWESYEIEYIDSVVKEAEKGKDPSVLAYEISVKLEREVNEIKRYLRFRYGFRLYPGGIPWMPDEDELFKTHTNQQIAHMTCRSRQSVSSHRFMLLKRDPNYCFSGPPAKTVTGLMVVNMLQEAVVSGSPSAMDDVTRRCGYTRGTWAIMFRDTTGIMPGKYHRMMRALFMCEHINNRNDVKMYELTDMLHQSPEQLRKSFFVATGITPRHYSLMTADKRREVVKPLRAAVYGYRKKWQVDPATDIVPMRKLVVLEKHHPYFKFGTVVDGIRATPDRALANKPGDTSVFREDMVVIREFMPYDDFTRLSTIINKGAA